MASTLTIRNVPPALHARLKRRAEEHRRSLNNEVIMLLEEAVGENRADREALFERIRKRREEGPTFDWGPKELKRKMREGLA